MPTTAPARPASTETPPPIPHLIPDDAPTGPEEGEVRRFWTGGPGSPQEAIVMVREGDDGKLHREKYRPGLDGAIVTRSPEAYAFVKAALGPRAWEDDIPVGLPSQRCTKCGWTTRSTRAYEYHANNAHR